MTIPRPRLTVRRLMIVVALTGLVLGRFDLMHRRREYALSKTRYFAIQASKHGLYGPRGVFYRRVAAKWVAAAARPWLPFEADPPAPE